MFHVSMLHHRELYTGCNRRQPRFRYILSIGGAGSLVVRRLSEIGHQVSISDNFIPQISGGNVERPADLQSKIVSWRCPDLVAGERS